MKQIGSKIKREWKFLSIFVICSLPSLISMAQSNTPVLRIGIMADMQYADKADHGSRFYHNSLMKVDTAVDFFNRNKVDFSLILGDLVDEGPKDLPVLLEHLSPLKKTTYCLLGNHDYVNVSKPDLLHTTFGMPAKYYAITKGKWRFVFLNTNALSEYATTPNSADQREWKTLVDSLQTSGRKNTQPWNGGVDRKQLKWLQNELAQARKNKAHVIVLTHHPLLPENGYETLNNREVLDILYQFPEVKLVLSGHHHKGNYVMANNIPFVTMEGMIETATSNAYGLLELYPKEIKIKGQGRLSSRVFKLSSK
ncbi:metallophosphoesterase [Sphingobacterium siyangense]|uniref:metallophosphoesterase n=1 Tax=Sphingobacterium siyangense TaxID=459529 RepID=UPI002FDA2B50